MRNGVHSFRFYASNIDDNKMLTNKLNGASRFARVFGVLSLAFADIVSFFLWILTASSVVASCFFHMPFTSFGAWLAIAFLSLLGHWLNFAAAVWNERPYWLSSGAIKELRNRTSLPIALLGSISFVDACVARGFWLGLAPFISLLILDQVFSGRALTFSELRIAPLRALFESACEGGVAVATDAARDDLSSKNELPRDARASADGGETDFDVVNDDRIGESGARRIFKLERFQTSDHSDQIVGEAVVEFEKDASFAVLNVPFCPPFEKIPTFDFELISGEEVSLRLSALQTYGARIEAQRSLIGEETRQDECAVIAFFAERSVETVETWNKH